MDTHHLRVEVLCRGVRALLPVLLVAGCASRAVDSHPESGTEVDLATSSSDFASFLSSDFAGFTWSDFANPPADDFASSPRDFESPPADLTATPDMTCRCANGCGGDGPCFECLRESDCTDPALTHCDLATHKCALCSCPAGQFCVSNGCSKPCGWSGDCIGVLGNPGCGPCGFCQEHDSVGACPG